MSAMPAALAVGAGAPAPMPTPADFEAAAPGDLPGLRDQVLKAAPPKSDVVARDTFGAAISKAFTAPGVGINSKRPEVQLNVAILIYELETLSSDFALIQMVQSTDASVRYWGAKGLDNIAARLVRVGAGRAVDALMNAGKIELSGVVLQQIIGALSKYGDMPKLVEVLSSVSDQMAKGMPDVTMLQSVAQGLDAVAAGIPAALAAEKVKAATTAARLASFSAQQLKKADDLVKANDPTGGVPRDVKDAVQKVVDSATKVLSAASGKSSPAPQGINAAELLMNVNLYVGSPGQPGTIQTTIKNVPIPPAITTGP